MITSGDLTNRVVSHVNPDAATVDEDGSLHLKSKRKTGMEPDLAARIAAARAVLPPRSEQVHCGHCFGEGREAAIRAFEAPAD